MGAKKGDGGETKRKWEKERNQDSEKRQWERRSCLEGSQTPVLQPENRPVWLSLLVLYSSTRPGRRFIVAITQIPLAFIPSLDASGLYSITVSKYRWKKEKNSSTQEKCQGLKSPLLPNTSSQSADLGIVWALVSIWYWATQPLFCILMTRDVDVCVTGTFDPEGECCPSQRSAAFHWACCVFRTTQSKSRDPGTPKSLDITGLWDSTSPPPPTLPTLQESFRPVVWCQLTDRCINYDHLLHQIFENEGKGQQTHTPSLCFSLSLCMHICNFQMFSVLFIFVCIIKYCVSPIPFL